MLWISLGRSLAGRVLVGEPCWFRVIARLKDHWRMQMSQSGGAGNAIKSHLRRRPRHRGQTKLLPR
jgi:hypothetical protein